jgi:hypothetical protein
MQISQGLHATMIRGKLSLYATRLFIQIVKQCNIYALNGTLSAQFLKKAADWHKVPLVMTVRISDVLTEGSQHYEEVRNACIELEKQILTYYENNIWHSSSMIYAVTHQDKSGVIRFEIQDWVVRLILDFSKGFQHYQLEGAMQLKSVYTIKMYMLMANQYSQGKAAGKFVMKWSIPALRKYLNCEDQYKLPADFIKRTIEPAQKELEQAGLNGYTYTVIKAGDGKRSPITGIHFHPVRREQPKAPKYNEPVNFKIKDYLMTQCFFTSRELGANSSLLNTFVKIPNYQDHLFAIVERQRAGRKSKGYIINAIKSETQAAAKAGILKQ